MTPSNVADHATLFEMFRASNDLAYACGRLWVRSDDRATAQLLDSFSGSFLSFGQAALEHRVTDTIALDTIGRVYEDVAILLRAALDHGNVPTIVLRKVHELRQQVASLIPSARV